MGIAQKMAGNMLEKMLPPGLSPEFMMQSVVNMTTLAQQFSDRIERMEENQRIILAQQEQILSMLRHDGVDAQHYFVETCR